LTPRQEGASRAGAGRRPVPHHIGPPGGILRGTRPQDEKQVNPFPRFPDSAPVPRGQSPTRRALAPSLALCLAALLPGCLSPARQGPRAPKHEDVMAPGKRHTVEKGETIWSIAKLYGVKPIDIVEVNNIKLEEAARLEAGRKLLIPPTVEPEPKAVADLRELEKRQESYEIDSEPYFVCPVTGPIIRNFHDPAGAGANCGIDIKAVGGANVVAAKSGVVVECASLAGWGNVILIDHGSNEKTFYAHLGAMKVSPGDRVKQRQVIGRVGTTGRVTGPTLHFRIYREGKPVDPRGRFSF